MLGKDYQFSPLPPKVFAPITPGHFSHVTRINLILITSTAAARSPGEGKRARKHHHLSRSLVPKYFLFQHTIVGLHSLCPFCPPGPWPFWGPRQAGTPQVEEGGLVLDVGAGRQAGKDGAGRAPSAVQTLSSSPPSSPSCSAKATGFCWKSGVLQPSGMSSTSCRMLTP